VLYHDICLVSVIGLRGTLHIQEAEDAEGVSVQTEGPYEAKVYDGRWLAIFPEGQEPVITDWFCANVPMTAGRTHVGSVDIIAKAQLLTDSAPRSVSRPRVRPRVAMRAKATVRITAPPGTRFELIGCHGLRQGPRGRMHLMHGKCRFDIR
jgi:hypothetical protein